MGEYQRKLLEAYEGIAAYMECHARAGSAKNPFRIAAEAIRTALP